MTMSRAYLSYFITIQVGSITNHLMSHNEISRVTKKVTKKSDQERLIFYLSTV